eukprot:763623-Hanusia_phi.AAC.11
MRGEMRGRSRQCRQCDDRTGQCSSLLRPLPSPLSPPPPPDRESDLHCGYHRSVRGDDHRNARVS